MATALPMHPPDRSQALNDVAIGYIPPQSSAQDFYSRRLTLSDIDFNKDSSKLASPSTPSTSTALPLSNSSTASPLPRQDAPMTEPSASSTWLDYPSHNINASFHPTPSGWLAQNTRDTLSRSTHYPTSFRFTVLRSHVTA
ncbi:hypothetical protein NLI96_g12648 [Meripilus lineatus]|uniref:Uncharacterized protein n=1 Tax=Meripilus lineatus TaxID=2056292 RepID=A0AAD5UPK6_9APHY|nr:hypothetical protein NLI96_g12648 [Physisporinus lineatus]